MGAYGDRQRKELLNSMRRPQRNVVRHIQKISEERGKFGEEKVREALYNLRDYYGVPIIVISSEKGGHKDRRGIDIEIRGRNPLHARFGIDVKSSRTGVETYKEKGRELAAMGIRAPYPSYPFLFQYEYTEELLLDLLRFILSKSESHKEFVSQVPLFSKSRFNDFDQEFSSLVKDIFQ